MSWFAGMPPSLSKFGKTILKGIFALQKNLTQGFLTWYKEVFFSSCEGERTIRWGVCVMRSLNEMFCKGMAPQGSVASSVCMWGKSQRHMLLILCPESFSWTLMVFLLFLHFTEAVKHHIQWLCTRNSSVCLVFFR